MQNKQYAYKKNTINKQRAEINSAHKKNNNKNNKLDKRNVHINLDDEIIIGMPNIDKKEYQSRNNGKKVEYVEYNKETKKIDTNKKSKKQTNKKKKVKKLSEKQLKRRKFIFKVIKWTSLFSVIVGGIIFIMLSPIFNIKTIQVKNNNKLSYEQIVSLSGIQINDNTFKYSKRNTKNKIKENAYIEEVKVSRLLPDVLQIDVEERTVKFMLLFGNAYVYINNQGYILEISNEKIDVPIIKGYETIEENIKPGKRLCSEDLEKLSIVLKIIEVCQSEEIYEKITGINIEDKNDYKIIMENDQKVAHLGDCSMLEERILWVRTILNDIKEIPGDIFVNMNLNLERPFFRERV